MLVLWPTIYHLRHRSYVKHQCLNMCLCSVVTMVKSSLMPNRLRDIYSSQSAGMGWVTAACSYANSSLTNTANKLQIFVINSSTRPR